MSDKEKLKRLEKALGVSAVFDEEAVKRIQEIESRLAVHNSTLKYLTRGMAVIGGIAGLSSGGVIGILSAPYVVQFIKSLFS